MTPLTCYGVMLRLCYDFVTTFLRLRPGAGHLEVTQLSVGEGHRVSRALRQSATHSALNRREAMPPHALIASLPSGHAALLSVILR